MSRTWRDMMEEPCTCSPGDGLLPCFREAECYEAWYTYGRRPVPDGPVVPGPEPCTFCDAPRAAETSRCEEHMYESCSRCGDSACAYDDDC